MKNASIICAMIIMIMIYSIWQNSLDTFSMITLLFLWRQIKFYSNWINCQFILNILIKSDWSSSFQTLMIKVIMTIISKVNRWVQLQSILVHNWIVEPIIELTGCSC